MSLKIRYSYQWNDNESKNNKQLYNRIRKFVLQISHNNPKVQLRRLRASSGEIIIENILKQISESDIYIIDLTFTNRNVLLELGSMLMEKYRLPKKKIYILKRKVNDEIEFFSNIPSNLSGFFISEYTLEKDGKVKIKDSNSFYSSLRGIIENDLKFESYSNLDSTILLNNNCIPNIDYRKYLGSKALPLDLLRNLFDKCYPKPPKDVYFKFLAEYKEGNPIYTAWVRNQLVGFVYCVTNSKGGYLESLCVDPDFQKLSIGRNLVNFLISDNRGIISLTTRIVEFFEEFNFKPILELEDKSTFMIRNKI